MKTGIWPLLLVCLAANARLSAINIVNQSPAINGLYSSGFGAGAPVRNSSSSFIGSGYDLTGVGWVSDKYTGRVGHVNLLGPLHSVGARHATITLLGTNARFVNAQNTVIDVALPGYAETSAISVSGNGTDLDLVTLRRALTATDAVSPMRILDISGGSCAGLPMFMFGSDDPAAGSQLASARVSGLSGGLVGVMGNGGDSALSYSLSEPGDSGSPATIIYKGKITFAGATYFADGTSSSLFRTYPGYDPAPVVNGRMAATGYALKWTIYDVPSDIARTANAWTGGGGTGVFGTAANWAAATVPAAGASFESRPVVFDGNAAGGFRVIDIGGGQAVRGMLFRSAPSSAGFTFGGVGALTVGATGIRNESVAEQVFSSAVTLSGSQNWEAAGGNLTFAGGIATGGNLLVVGGDRDTAISGIISGTGALAKDDAGLLTLGAINTYSGSTFLHNGTMRLGPGGSLPATSLAFIANNPAVLDLNGRSQTLTGVTSSYGGTGRILLGGATLTVNRSVADSSIYSGSIEGAGTVVKSGAGNWTLSGANTFSGALQVDGGLLRMGSPGALPGNVNLRLNNNALIELGADYSGALGIGAGQIQFLGAGGFGAAGGNRIVNLGGVGATLLWGGTHFLPGSAANFFLSSSSSTGRVDFQNGVDLGGAYRAFVVEDGAARIDARLNGPVSNGYLVKHGAGVLELAVANSYTATQVNNGALLVSAVGGLPPGNVAFNGGSGVLLLGSGDCTRGLGAGAGQVFFHTGGGFGASGANRVVNLGGAAAALVWGAGGFVPSGASLYLSSVAADAMVDFRNPVDLAGGVRTVEVNNGSADIDATLSGGVFNGTLVKTGAGALALSGAIDQTGETRVNGGSLYFSGNADLPPGNINLNGGVLLLGEDCVRPLGVGVGRISFGGSGGFAAYGASRTINLGGLGTGVTWGAGSFVPAGASLLLSSGVSGGTVTFANPIDLAGAVRTVSAASGRVAIDARLSGVIGNGGLNKIGAGTLELMAANTYSGVTIVTEGALRTASGSLPSAGNLALAGGVIELTSDFSRALGTGAGQVSLGGGGGFSAAGATRAVNLGGAGATVAWASGPFVADGKRLVFSAKSSDATLEFKNPILLGSVASGQRTIHVDNGTAAVDARLTAALTSSGIGWGFQKTGDGTLELAGASTYAGATTLQAGRVLLTGSLANTAIVEINSGAQLELAGTLATGTVIIHPGGVLRGRGTINAVVINDGRVEAVGFGSTLTIAGAVINRGAVTATDGAFLSADMGFSNAGVLDLGDGSPQSLPANLQNTGTVVPPPTDAGASLLLEFAFDGAGEGNLVPNGGRLGGVARMQDVNFVPQNRHAAQGSGVSGLPWDMAYDSSDASPTMSTSGSPVGGRLWVGDIDPGSGSWLSSFTLQGWFKSPEMIAGGVRLFDAGGSSSFQLRGNVNPGGEGTLALVFNDFGVVSGKAYTQVGRWVFFAVTYDSLAASDQLKFYVGATSGNVSLVSSHTVSRGSLTAGPNDLVIGNKTTPPGAMAASTYTNAAFHGLLDNMRMYGALAGSGGALSVSSLEAIRLVDVSGGWQTPQLTLQVRQGSNEIHLASGLGFSYQLQRSTTLTAWENLGAPAAGTGSELVLIDATTPPGDRVFYRVTVAYGLAP